MNVILWNQGDSNEGQKEEPGKWEFPGDIPDLDSHRPWRWWLHHPDSWRWLMADGGGIARQQEWLADLDRALTSVTVFPQMKGRRCNPAHDLQRTGHCLPLGLRPSHTITLLP